MTKPGKAVISNVKQLTAQNFENLAESMNQILTFTFFNFLAELQPAQITLLSH